MKGSSSSGLVFARVVGEGVDLARVRLTDGAVAALVTTPDRDEAWPYWSELARRLVFEVGAINGRSPADLWLWLPNTGADQPVTRTPRRSERWASWSPVTTDFAFAFIGAGDESGVARSDVRSSGGAQVLARATTTDFFLRPTFAPDGSRLVAQRRGPGGRGSNLWILSTEESPRQITNDPEWFDFKAWFTRGGDRIVYSRRPASGGWHEIASVDAKGDTLRRHAPFPESDAHSARPSPTRDEIAFVSNRAGAFDLYLASLDDDAEALRNLSGSPDRNEFAPRWSPDGELVVVTVVDEEHGLPRLTSLESLAGARIVVYDRSGQVRLDTEGFMPDWMPAW